MSRGITSPIPPKRQRVEISLSGSGIDISHLSPEDWILRSKSGSEVKLFLSKEPPVYEGVTGHNFIYKITGPGGSESYIFTPMLGTTELYQNKDIIWTNKQ